MSQDENAVNEQVVADTTATESAPVENQSEVVEESVDTGEYTEADVTEEQEEQETETPAESNDAEEPEAQDDNRGEEQLAPKSVNRFQKLANENRELREQLAQLEARKAQVATEQELLNQINPETGDYYTIAEAERAARMQANERQQEYLQVEEYNLQVQQNQQQLSNEANKSIADFPELDSSSDKFDEAVALEYEAALSQALILDQQGMPIGAHMSPYQLAKSIVTPARAAAERAKALGQAEAQKATAKMLASSDPSSSSSQSNKSFESLSLKEMEARLRAKGHQI